MAFSQVVVVAPSSRSKKRLVPTFTSRLCHYVLRSSLRPTIPLTLPTVLIPEPLRADLRLTLPALHRCLWVTRPLPLGKVRLHLLMPLVSMVPRRRPRLGIIRILFGLQASSSMSGGRGMHCINWLRTRFELSNFFLFVPPPFDFCILAFECVMY